MPLSAGSAAPISPCRPTAAAASTLSKLKGQTVILYFYPKDDTTGCTAEACGFRDAMLTSRVRRRQLSACLRIP